ATAAAGEPLAIVRVVYPLVAVVIAKRGQLGHHLLLRARATSSAGRRLLTEEPHAGGSLAHELPIQVVPQTLPGRRSEARLGEIPEHDLLARHDDVHRQVGLPSVRSIKECGFVVQRVAARHAGYAGRAS